MKTYDKVNANNQENISNLNHLENILHAQRNYYQEKKHNLLLKTTGAINRIVDKKIYGELEQGVNIGAPEVIKRGSRKQNYSMNPLIGTDSATYLPSNNAVELLVDGLFMGGARPKTNKDLINARKAMDKFLSGERKTKPMVKHLQLLQEHEELEGGKIFKNYQKVYLKQPKASGKLYQKQPKKSGKNHQKQ